MLLPTAPDPLVTLSSYMVLSAVAWAWAWGGMGESVILTPIHKCGIHFCAGEIQYVLRDEEEERVLLAIKKAGYSRLAPSLKAEARFLLGKLRDVQGGVGHLGGRRPGCTFPAHHYVRAVLGV